MAEATTPPRPGVAPDDPIVEMDRAVRALALEVPAEVAADVDRRWHAAADELIARERGRWRILHEAFLASYAGYTIDARGSNAETLVDRSAEDMQAALKEWLRGEYRVITATMLGSRP